MKKRWMMAGMTVWMIISLAGCGTKEEGITKLETELATVITEESAPATQTANAGVTYSYYVVDSGAGELIEMTEQTGDTEVNPDTILWLLSTGDVIPEGITCSNLNQKEEDGKLTVYASLSGSLRDYMGGIGDASQEALIIAALTNSFLDNYKADYFRLSVDGANLETPNHLYDKALGYFGTDMDLMNWEGFQYELVDAQIQSENALFSATYPQFENVEDAGLKAQFNEAVKSYIDTKMAEATNATIMIRYEVTYQDDDFVSVILRGEKNGAEQNTRFAATFNFDFTEKTLRRLTSSMDISGVIDRIELGMNYEVTGESQMTQEQFVEYQNSGMNDDFMMQLLDYDFVLGNSNMVPLGFSYMNQEEKMVIVMPVPAELGGYVEIQLN